MTTLNPFSNADPNPCTLDTLDCDRTDESKWWNSTLRLLMTCGSKINVPPEGFKIEVSISRLCSWTIEGTLESKFRISETT